MITVEINEAEMQREVVDLIKRFRKLPPEIAKKRMRSAVRKATRPFESALRSRTPYHTGNMMRSLNSKVKVYDHANSGAVVAITGFARGSLKKKRGMFVVSGSGAHAKFVERGTKFRRRKNGASCGQMPAQHITRKTLDANRGPILSAMRSELAAALEKAAADLAKTSGG